MNLFRTRLHVLGSVAASCALAATCSSATSAQEVSKEYKVKAAFLYNFAQFVSWPAEAFRDAGSPIVIGVFGANPFGTTLDAAVEGKRVGNRPFEIKYFKTVDDMTDCHVLYVAATDADTVGAVLKRIGGKSVLTIGETEQFPWGGGVIRFYSEDNKIRFEINVEAADGARLAISSKLLKLARIFKR